MTRPGATIDQVEPSWPEPVRPPVGAPNVLVVLFDDVGFADFGCYGSEVATPTIDRLAGAGLRMTGFHTTAMCSTTRAALFTGRNHHSVGMGCLANFDSGYPGYRGRVTRDAPMISEVLGAAGYRNYMLGKWHLTNLTESGPTGPFDGWPLGRGFHRFYGFLDAETDQYSPELVRDNSPIAAPGDHTTGYHLTEDLADQAIAMWSSHEAADPALPWFTMFAPGACHAPHQAPVELIDHYERIFRKGWDATRHDRLARQIELGIVPAGTVLPDRNPMVRPWDAHTDDERAVFARLMAAYAAMLDHTDRQLARLVDHLERSGQLDNTIVIVTSDNGSSQEGGPNGFVNAMGPYNGRPEPMVEKSARLADIGGPDTHSNIPWGFAMAANTPLKRYKQNTHGGGVRDPFVIHWPAGLPTDGSLRTPFAHVCDLAPTLYDLVGLAHPDGLEGVSFEAALHDPDATTGKVRQYFEMFGHRGIWLDGWKAVAYHQPGTSFDDDRWELYHLDVDVNEVHDLAAAEPERLAAMIDAWWDEAEANQVLPLDDRFAERFAENAERHRGGRTRYVFWNGMEHLPGDVAPDLRSRSYTISAEVDLRGLDVAGGQADGVIVAHGDATGGWSLFVRDGRLVHDLNVGGEAQLLASPEVLPAERLTLGFRMDRHQEPGHPVVGDAQLTVDGSTVARMETGRTFFVMVSWSGLDIGMDRGTTVSDYDRTGRYVGPNVFGGRLRRVVVDLHGDQELDHEAVGAAEMARE